MKTKTIRLKLTGIAPLLMHNGQLADPLNEHARALKVISAKRKKTDDDYADMADVEWIGGLYVDDGRVILPGDSVEAALIAAAKKSRSGPQAKAGLFVPGNAILDYTGPKGIDALKKDPKFRLRKSARIGTNRIMRTRPKFDDWSAVVEIAYNPSMLNVDQIVEFATTCGESVGIGDWKPRYGRFTVEVAA